MNIVRDWHIHTLDSWDIIACGFMTSYLSTESGTLSSCGGAEENRTGRSNRYKCR
ncbi:hypothetical protein KIN20_009539 [Parelaphostrongylus tenuis]|uniref:Uncharacterized protein n=1 Tax=Parelaphostrongylus tenuis TaxID=148309 RepID=A0AAD5M8B5_PARTN|nr:hypothetical protein KIN20_009539 [Parelaphostrongylus tenuis]